MSDTFSAMSEVDLIDDGVLWMINATIFHPRGLALAITPDGRFFVEGAGNEVIVFADETADLKFEQFRALLARHQALVSACAWRGF